MDHSTLAILVMLNNWFHDFSVAMLFSGLMMLRIIYRKTQEQPDAPWLPFARSLTRSFNKVIHLCWAMLILLGIGRTVSYEKYEWAEAAGSGQLTALVLKHILLGSLVVWGTIIQFRLRKFLKESKI